MNNEGLLDEGQETLTRLGCDADGESSTDSGDEPHNFGCRET
jgi:hypothetical protein